MSIRPLLEPTGKDNKTLNLYCNSVDTSSIVADELKIDNLEVKDIKCDTLEATSLIQTEDLDASGDIDCENLIAGSISNPPLNSIDFKNTLLYNIDEIYINNNLYTPSILSLTNQVNFNNNSITGANNISGNKIITPLIESDTKQINFNNNTLASINGVFTTSVVSPVLEAIGGNISFNNNNLNDIANLQLSTLNNELLSYPQSSSVFTLNQGAFNYNPLPRDYTYYYQFSGNFASNLDITNIEQGKYDGQTIYIGIVGSVGSITIKNGVVGGGISIDCGGLDIVITPSSTVPLKWCRLTYSSNYNNLGIKAWVCSSVQN